MSKIKLIKESVLATKRAFMINFKYKKGKLPYPSEQVAVTLDGGYPIFLADDYVFIKTGCGNIPQAIAVAISEELKEIYVNDLFLTLPPTFQDAIIQHEVGHLKLGAIYSSKDRFLTNLGLSNKAFLCECAADDYSKSGGHPMLQTLMYLHQTYPTTRTGEMRKRILRLIP